MAELKTKQTEQSVPAFLETLPDEAQRQDSFTLLEIFQRATGAEPKLWGDSIIGFGNIHLKYASGRELDWFLAGFSPRKQALTLYLTQGNLDSIEMLKQLGKYKTGKGCLYIKRLADVDRQVLEELIRETSSRQRNP